MTLPIHGFVLAGGKSSRMGRDKALLEIGGKPLIEIAVRKLQHFCAHVSIAGNRDDFAAYAPVVREARIDAGPAAGIEAGLQACSEDWAMFMPVDVPLVPESLLRLWAEEALRMRMCVSYLCMQGKQPAFCLLQRERLATVSRLLDEGERRLEPLLNATADADKCVAWMYDEYDLDGYPNYRGPGTETVAEWFRNVNTREDWVALHAAWKPRE